MVETSSGHWMLGYVALSILMGHIVIRRIIRVPV
jgi:Flp pilus assembly protein TadB